MYRHRRSDRRGCPAVLQFEHAAWTDGGADAATHAGRAHYILALLGVGSHVDAHLAVRRAVAAGHALTAVGGDPKAAEESLNEAENRRLRASEATPHAAAEKRIEPDADDSGENSPDEEAVPLAQRTRPASIQTARHLLIDPQRRADDHDGDKHRVDHIQRSIFHALVDLLDNCRKGSPRVSARPPHPHTHEQYQRLPKK